MENADGLPRLGNDRDALERSIREHVRYSLCKPWESGNKRDLYLSLAHAVRDRLVERMLETEARFESCKAKRVYYLSMEFLLGRSLGNNLYNLGIFDTCADMVKCLGADLEEVREIECDAALGNGGLGRLAACFLDSLATLDLPGYGYGLNYEYGLFKQEISDGYQREKPDNWLAEEWPWRIHRPDDACLIPIYGRIEHGEDLSGAYNPMWLDWQAIVGVPYDMPVVGFGGNTVNYLRLFSAWPSSEFDINIFNEGDYFKAVEQKIATETISKILYPADSFEAGRELRLVQEYFLVACSLRDIVRRYLKSGTCIEDFPGRVAIQMNDTHPSLAVVELMRILVDEHALPWEKSWDIVTGTLGYTNHTLLPEALEKWPVHLMETVLPRHMQLIYEINHRFLQQVSEVWPGDCDRCRRLSIIKEGVEKQVRMANLAVIGSHSTNGVAALHTRLLKSALMPEFHALWPERFNNKTNGVTQRRWLLKANPFLAGLLARTIGEGWITDLARLVEIEPYAEDKAFQEDFRKAKQLNKERLRKVILAESRVSVSTETLFDVHAKRIHEYKRQFLKVMHIIHEYLLLIEDGREPQVPRTFIFAGKAAPGYWVAKQIIKLINNLAEVINADRRAKDWIRVVFLPDYRVSLAERIIPAADLSEQISTAGKEASGTGNMKFAMNGALTVGTLDGANVEILEEVGEENIYIFGLTTEQIQEMRGAGAYHPRDYYNRHPEIRRVMDALRDDVFCPREPGLFKWLYHRILDEGDEYFHLADFLSYIEAQERAAMEYRSPAVWNRKAILNVARIGKFSSDRSIEEYAREIWGLRRV